MAKSFRYPAVLLVCSAVGPLAGCAASPGPHTAEIVMSGQSDNTLDIGTDAGRGDDAVPASSVAPALVFRPPASADLPPEILDRDPRRPSAFIGFEGPVTEHYHVYTVDTQVSGGCGSPWRFGHGCGPGYLDRYERRAVTEKVGTLHR